MFLRPESVRSSDPVLERCLLLLDEIILIELFPHIIRHLLSLLVLGHVNVILSNSHGLKSLSILCLEGLVAVIDVLLVDPALDSTLLGDLLLFLGLLVAHQLLCLLLVGALQLDLLLLSTEDSHLTVFGDLCQLLLLVALLDAELLLLHVLICVVPITHLLWLAIHDVSFIRLHVVRFET